MLRKIFVYAGILGFAAAQADELAGPYIGAGIGSLNYKESSVGFDADDTAIKLFGGYRFNPWIAVEASYINGGKPSQVIARQTIEIEPTAIAVQAVGSVPLRHGFGLVGEIGIASWKATARNVTFGGEISDDGSDVIYGLGGQYDFRFPLRLRAEYQTINVSDADVDLFTVSAIYRF